MIGNLPAEPLFRRTAIGLRPANFELSRTICPNSATAWVRHPEERNRLGRNPAVGNATFIAWLGKSLEFPATS
jgi:hypothetical protein